MMRLTVRRRQHDVGPPSELARRIAVGDQSLKLSTVGGANLGHAEKVFQAHGAAADGSVVFGKKLSRPKFASFATSRD